MTTISLDAIAQVSFLALCVSVVVAAVHANYRKRRIRELTKLPTIPADMPSPVDPMGTNGSGSMFQESLRQMIQQAVAFEMRGRTSAGLDGIASQHLALELIARGWIAYLPKEPK